jgi:hypothetical protein
MSADHERIWLQNAKDALNQDTGRMWCEDKVWPDDAEDGEPTEYVRADLYETALSERNAAQAEAKTAIGMWKSALARGDRVDEAETELKKLMLAYVNLMENGHDRIVSLGGSCDPVDVMEKGDPYLRRAREFLERK